MIIDAMDILHSEKVDGFCLVSSDSDFTRLATRLRESGMLVIGIGEKKTPRPFIVACDKFIYIEIISKLNIQKTENSKTEKSPDKDKDKDKIADVEKISNNLIGILKNSVDAIADDSGWAFLAEVGALIIKKKPDFDPRNYGFTKLTPLFKSLNKHFIIDEREVEKTHIKHIFIKIK
jgi:uncharacterized LabA/DUF88 family protein